MSVAALVDRARLWRLPLNLIRGFSARSAAAPPPSTADSEVAKKKRRNKAKPKNLIEVCKHLPNWGLGHHVAKRHWTKVTYEITKIRLYKTGRTGKAWGLAYKCGIPSATAQRIGGVHKHCWKYIKNPKIIAAPEIAPQDQAETDPEAQEEIAPEAPVA